MNKKIYAIGICAIAACVIAGCYYLERSRGAYPTVIPQPPAANTTSLDPLNATYRIDGVAVTLVNGRSEQPAAPHSAETMKTQIFGVPVLGEINGTTTDVAAVILTQDGGGSGTFYYVAVALGSASTGTIGTNAVFLGDRIAPDTIQITNGIVTVNYADRKVTDPMSTPPSVGVSKYLVVAGTTLYDIPTDIYPLPSGMVWESARDATVAPGDENITEALVGINIVSQPITNITDLSATSLPFEKYYKTKLAVAGWTEDNALAAGGPGSDIIGYKKGDSYIILGYTSLFKNNSGNSPETCPCDMTFSIFAGTPEATP